MTPKSVHEYLTKIGSQWTGQGVAIELGSWLGASAYALLQGLVPAGYDQPFYCFDNWICVEGQIPKAKAYGVDIQLNQDLLPLFLNNVTPIYDNIKPAKGSIRDSILKWDKKPIEICLFDAPKQEPIFSDSMRGVLPYFIEGVTELGLLDYYFYESKTGPMREKFMAPVNFMKKYGHHFQQTTEFKEGSCVFFKYIKKIKGF